MEQNVMKMKRCILEGAVGVAMMTLITIVGSGPLGTRPANAATGDEQAGKPGSGP